MTTKPPCPECGHVHVSTWARAVRRFHPRGQTGYRAALPGAQVRATRREAEADVCRHLKGEPS